LPEALGINPDYVLIQFGHNDQPGKGPERETDPNSTFRDFLRLYIREFRAIGTKPILVSSLVRRMFDGSGHIQSDLTPWVDAACAVAQEMNVPFVDLHSVSMALHNRIGQEVSMEFNRREGDTTHLNEKGAEAVTELVIAELRKVAPELADMAE
jgi:pectinesterase